MIQAKRDSDMTNLAQTAVLILIGRLMPWTMIDKVNALVDQPYTQSVPRGGKSLSWLTLRTQRFQKDLCPVNLLFDREVSSDIAT